MAPIVQTSLNQSAQPPENISGIHAAAANPTAMSAHLMSIPVRRRMKSDRICFIILLFHEWSA